MGGDWSELLPDLLAMISRRLVLIEDFVAFRGVCTSWRAAAPKDNFVKHPSSIPLLMLAENRDNDDREFFSLYKGKIWTKFPLPEAKKRRCMESRGWLITVGSHSGDMNLLHPFSRVQIPLPNLSKSYIAKAVLSTTPSRNKSYYVVVIHCRYGPKLRFWRPGNESWTKIEATDGEGKPFPIDFRDVNFCHGKLYAMDIKNEIWVWDDDPSSDSAALVLLPIRDPLILYGTKVYIVESSSPDELLVVARTQWDLFEIAQLDLIKRQWKEPTNLNGRSIFVGHNSVISVDATIFPGVIKPNWMYSSDDTKRKELKTALLISCPSF